MIDRTLNFYIRPVVSLFAGSIFLLLCSCSKPVLVKVAKVSETPVETVVTTVSSGTVEAQQQALLSFGVTGRVLKLNKKLGDQVKKGDKIAQLDNSDFKTAFDLASRELNTSSKLISEGLISQANQDEAQRNFEAAKNNWEKSWIIAPFDGQLSELNLQVGETVGPTSTNTSGKVYVRIVDSLPRYIKGNIDEIDLPKVKVGSKARIRIQSLSRDSIQAMVTKVIPFISTSKEQERTAQIEISVEQSTLVLPVGASADIEVVVDRKEKAIGAPSRAVMGLSGQRYVFLVENNKLKKVDIKTGLGNYEVIEVLEGLKLGDSVALPSESVELKDDLKIQPEIIQWP